MFSPKRDETRPGYEMRKEHIAIGVMILLCLPILAIYVTFFAQAFVKTTCIQNSFATVHAADGMDRVSAGRKAPLCRT